MLKQYTLFILLSLVSFFSNAQLAAGDIAFLGMNTDAEEGFAFITLTDIPGGEEIYFSDRGIVNASSWNVSIEMTLTFTTPPAGISCGTVVSFVETGADVLTISGAPGASYSFLTTPFNLGAGDQITAFQYAPAGFPPTPGDATFIAGIHTNHEDGCEDATTLWTLEACVSNTSESALPPGLTNGVNAMALTPGGPEIDNGRYSGTLTGTSDFIRGEINDYTNWVISDDAPYDITPGVFSPAVECVAPCDNPDVPTLAYSPEIICEGETATLSITGALNDATEWHIYTGSCGGTEVGTTAGGSIAVTPEAPSTTYFVRGEGGCVTPGSCGSIIVTLAAEDDPTFFYDELVYCPNGEDPSPTATEAGGTFSGTPGGLVIDAASGLIDLSESALGTYTIMHTTSGACPNSTTSSFTIEDNENPVPDLDELPDITAECEVTSLPTPSVTDNCTGLVTITNDADLPISEPGTTIVTWTYDDGNGNSTTQTQTILINDISGPTPDVETLADITAECEVTTLSFPTATDNCGGAVVVSNDASLPITDEGLTTVVWTYTDVNGNTTTQPQNVILNDITPPLPTEDPLENINTACALTELETPVATDNCSDEVTVTTDATFPITESTTIIWTYDDGNGNIVTQSQEIVFDPIDVSVTADAITLTANNLDADTYQWVDCDESFEPIVGANSPSFEAPENGNYAVVITENTCTDTSACIAITQVGLEQWDEIKLTIYPNPVSTDFVTIVSEAEISTVKLVDLAGKSIPVVYHPTTNRVDLTPITKGTYILMIRTNTNQLVRTSIIKL